MESRQQNFAFILGLNLEPGNLGLQSVQRSKASPFRLVKQNKIQTTSLGPTYPKCKAI